MAPRTFLVPDEGGTVLLGLLLIVPAILLVVLVFVFWPRALQVEVTPSELKVTGSIYGRTLSRADLELDRVRAVNLGHERALSPVLRSNGIALANYRVGWFRLRNGQRALCFLTRVDSVIYLPTKKDFVLLFSTSEPNQLLAALGK